MTLTSDELTRDQALGLLDALLAANIEHVRLDVRQVVAGAGGIPEQPAIRYRVFVLPKDADSNWNDQNLEPVLKVARALNFTFWLYDDHFAFYRRDSPDP